MFQYATGRALALRNRASLVLDTKSGFVRDKIYRRTFSLGSFPLEARRASLHEQLPFWYERWHQKIVRDRAEVFDHRPWGLYVQETEGRFLRAVRELQFERDIYLEGYWQSERYFSEQRTTLQNEFRLPEPNDRQFRAMSDTIQDCNSVAVGVRLFEEVPGADKSGVGGLVPYSFYTDAADRLADRLLDPVFFVFCTRDEGVRNKLRLPGPVHYLTHDNGFAGEMRSLRLISQCAHHILSNSSFYWWGAWLAERNHGESIVIACDQFANSDAIPPRWQSISLAQT